MVILAKAIKGKEYCYIKNTAHQVSKSSANKIKDVLNDYQYTLKADEVWHKYEIDKYDGGYDYAEMQAFRIRNGLVKDVQVRSF